MTSTATLKAKMIATLIEASDLEDPKDCEQILKMVKALLEEEKKA